MWLLEIRKSAPQLTGLFPSVFYEADDLVKISEGIFLLFKKQKQKQKNKALLEIGFNELRADNVRNGYIWGQKLNFWAKITLAC